VTGHVSLLVTLYMNGCVALDGIVEEPHCIIILIPHSKFNSISITYLQYFFRKSYLQMNILK